MSASDNSQRSQQSDAETLEAHREAVNTRLMDLSGCGAAEFNRVRFEFIHTLLRRSGEARAAVNSQLLAKAQLELDRYQADLFQAEQRMTGLLNQIQQSFPDALSMTKRYAEHFDVNGVARLLSRLQCGAEKNSSALTLSALTKLLVTERVVPDKQSSGLDFDEYLQQQEGELLQGLEPTDISTLSAGRDGRALPELKSSRHLRQLKLKEKAEGLVNKALSDSPASPGPLNPQMLATRALKGMRDLSPQYLNRLITYIDTLLWIERAGEKYAPAKRAKKESKARARKGSQKT